VFSGIETYLALMSAKDLPSGISTAANARDPVGLNRSIYTEIAENLAGNRATPGCFDLMNKGITILAKRVQIINAKHHVLQVEIPPNDSHFGIVDGAHTGIIINNGTENNEVHELQYVWVTIRTGVPDEIAPLVAQGLNTGLKVAPQSIYDLEGTFDWLREEMAQMGLEDVVRWRESDKGSYDVRDIIAILECFNAIEFSNDKDRHPISAYEKFSIPLQRFHNDYQAYAEDIKNSQYHRLRPLLRGALMLYDHVGHDFREIYNKQVKGGKGQGGKLSIMNTKTKGKHQFPFARLSPEASQLHKGALFPILASLRNYVVVDPHGKKDAKWLGSFDDVLMEWNDWGPDGMPSRLVSMVANSANKAGVGPDGIGKDRSLWGNLHSQVALHLARRKSRSAKA